MLKCRFGAIRRELMGVRPSLRVLSDRFGVLYLMFGVMCLILFVLEIIFLRVILSVSTCRVKFSALNLALSVLDFWFEC